MKKLLNFRTFVVIIWIATIILIFKKVDDEATRFSLLVVTIPVYGALIITSLHYKYENESRKNPIHLSAKDSGKIFRVNEIDDNIVGLTRWGYKDYALQDIEDYQTFYFVSDIPVKFRGIDSLFKFVKQENEFIFFEVKMNGFKDKTKEPFEVLPRIFYV